MAGRVLLDTNIVIALFADEAAIKQRLAESDEVFVSSVAVGELCFGARKSGRPRENLARIDELAAETVVLSCDVETGRRYGEIKSALRLKGTPIPENDIWTAAIALQHDVTLATRDSHFGAIEGLKTAAW